jgi:hypothetical protein
MIIKAGYTLTYSTWENDGDYRKDNRIEGLTKEEIDDTIEFLKIFVSKNNRKPGTLKTYGNSTSCINFVELYEIHKPKLIIKTIKSDNPDFIKILDEWCENEDVFALKEKNLTEDELFDTMTDSCSDIVYNLLSGSEYYTARVYNNDAKVFYTPIDLILTDVTEQFDVK